MQAPRHHAAARRALAAAPCYAGFNTCPNRQPAFRIVAIAICLAQEVRLYKTMRTDALSLLCMQVNGALGQQLAAPPPALAPPPFPPRPHKGDVTQIGSILIMHHAVSQKEALSNAGAPGWHTYTGRALAAFHPIAGSEGTASASPRLRRLRGVTSR